MQGERARNRLFDSGGYDRFTDTAIQVNSLPQKPKKTLLHKPSIAENVPNNNDRYSQKTQPFVELHSYVSERLKDIMPARIEA